jgi:drug/metabolite transporter (DMT)-like permease
MNNYQKKWVYLLVLSLIWGSSFILMKKSLIGLTALQMGSLRILITGFILIGVGFKSLKTIKKENYKWIAATGFLGTFFPAFFFSFAQTELDSSIASILNSLVPLNTILIGLFVYKISATKRQFFGVFIGLAGTILLIFHGAQINPNQNYFYAIFVILATVSYAMSVNIIKKYLQHEGALAIAAGNFIAIMIPAFIALFISDFFSEATFSGESFNESLAYIILLAIVGTAFAKVLFNKLVHIASPVFASSVTYMMTLVAVLWGVLDGEKIGFTQVIGGVVILIGVYLANRKSKS